MGDKLNPKEKAWIGFEASLQLIPYVGSALSTAYFGTKQEKRFKRLESFYEEFSRDVGEASNHFVPFDQHEEDKVISLIEELNEKVERESIKEKIDYFKNYLYSILATRTGNNFDERRFFLETLSKMTLLEIGLLNEISTLVEPVRLSSLHREGVDQYAIVGAIGRLRSNGYLKLENRTIAFTGGDDSLHDSFIVSNFGQTFIDFCIQTDGY
ncbi:hypothetical protein [Rossellomorea marisflavi]|uniref:hypothetical protein n=1 Tax=Rossellomorea marisflavi TaxID=189381 RepID=UPI003D2EA3FB